MQPTTILALVLAISATAFAIPEPTLSLPPMPCSGEGDPCSNEGPLMCCNDQNLFCNAPIAGQAGVCLLKMLCRPNAYSYPFASFASRTKDGCQLTEGQVEHSRGKLRGML